MSRMIAAARAGDAAQAAALDTQLSGLHEKLFVESNPIPVKWALERMGNIRGRLRLPLTPLSQRHFATIEAALMQAGVSLAAAA
jgi:4-hydroxy-tetrahydrodipicolinate synthase